MAIFYEHIKGLSTNSDDITHSAFQYIKWQKVYNTTNEGMLPQFYNNATSYGHLVVSGDIDQTLEGLLKLNKKQLSIKSPNGNYWKLQTDLTLGNESFTNQFSLCYNGTTRLFSANPDNSGSVDIPNLYVGSNLAFGYSGHGSIGISGDYCNMFLNGNIYLGTNNSTTNKIYRDGDNYSLKLSGKAEIADHVQATYFNAQSDKRLKTNINPLPSTLDFVCKTPLYSFNYTTNGLPSIGVVAQDIQDAQFGNFKPAYYKNGSRNEKDFLSVHESKFVYILWKAIQEQQKEIEALKAEIAELKKTEN